MAEQEKSKGLARVKTPALQAGPLTPQPLSPGLPPTLTGERGSNTFL